jgi:hypothetical protein
VQLEHQYRSDALAIADSPEPSAPSARLEPEAVRRAVAFVESWWEMPVVDYPGSDHDLSGIESILPALIERTERDLEPGKLSEVLAVLAEYATYRGFSLPSGLILDLMVEELASWPRDLWRKAFLIVFRTFRYRRLPEVVDFYTTIEADLTERRRHLERLRTVKLKLETVRLRAQWTQQRRAEAAAAARNAEDERVRQPGLRAGKRAATEMDEPRRIVKGADAGWDGVQVGSLDVVLTETETVCDRSGVAPMAPKPGAAATIFHREEASQHDETWKSVGMGASADNRARAGVDVPSVRDLEGSAAHSDATAGSANTVSADGQSCDFECLWVSHQPGSIGESRLLEIIDVQAGTALRSVSIYSTEHSTCLTYRPVMVTVDVHHNVPALLPTDTGVAPREKPSGGNRYSAGEPKPAAGSKLGGLAPVRGTMHPIPYRCRPECQSHPGPAGSYQGFPMNSGFRVGPRPLGNAADFLEGRSGIQCRVRAVPAVRSRLHNQWRLATAEIVIGSAATGAP